MFKRLSSKRLIGLLLGIIIFIAIMGLTLFQREAVTWPEKITKDTVAWVQGAVYRPASAINGFFKDVRNLQIVYSENQQLRTLLSEYARDSARLTDLEDQNARLKAGLDFAERHRQTTNYSLHIAEVVAVSPERYNQTVTINLGSNDGIREDWAVMTTEGLIGTVHRVTPFYANVQLLTDLNDQWNTSKAIAATVKGKESVSFGMIERYDETTGLLIMNRIYPDDPLAVGDLVITSGLGQVYPSGVPIGEVVYRGEGDFGIMETAHIKPIATLTHLREVFVIEAPFEIPTFNGSGD